MAFKALEGVKVVEYCQALSAPYCTKLMADLGAEVIHIETPGDGDQARRLPPFAGGAPDPEKSGVFLFLNSNKLGITLNPQTAAGKKIFQQLVSAADVLVEDWPPGHLEDMGLGYDDLHALNPALVMASITPFGRSGPYARYKAYGLNISHVSGQGYMLPMPAPDLQRAPVKTGGHCTDYDAGQTAAVAILAALYWKGVSGKGQFIEVSQQEAVLALQRVENVVFANGGEVLTRKGFDKERAITQMFDCTNGHVISCAPLDHQRAGLAQLVGCQEGAPPREMLDAWMRQRTIEEASAAAQALSCPMSPINSPAQVAQSQQLNARGFFAAVEHPRAGAVTMPARLCHFSTTPFSLERAAPLLGEHNELIYGERLGYHSGELHAFREAGVI